ncbi:anti-sigma factor domain-containing protein [Solicola sp. PLA-1-18]|uniref:anti-sigma factor domain-containing protein n=1 Tax=Solicola sp. PLA-1-18 TaxID=3380532 RepID=UPI003B7BB870
MHPDPELLASVATAEPVPADVEAHVASCTSCTAEVRELAALATRLRARRSVPDLAATTVPPSVWAAVVAETAEPEAVPSRSRGLGRLAAAAAVGLIVGGGAVLAVTAGDDSPVVSPPATSAATPSPTVLATGQIRPLAGATTTGSATVVDSPRGRVLDLDLRARDDVPSGHYVEAWLFDPATLDMVSVGVVSGDRARLAVPADLDLTTFTGVDLSLEPLDADPAHGTSLAQADLG